MWKIVKISCLALLLSFSASFASVSQAVSTTVTNPPGQTRVISEEQYNNFMRTIAELETRLEMLKSNSQEDSKRLKLLEQQLENSKNQIRQAQDSLTTAKDYSENLNNNLKTLEVQVDEMEHKLAVKERQNKLGWTVAAILMGVVIAEN